MNRRQNDRNTSALEHDRKLRLSLKLLDGMIIDRVQANAFACLGGRGIFTDWRRWPTVERHLGEASRYELHTEGPERWEALGGYRDSNGMETVDPTSPLGAASLSSAARKYGGILWHDHTWTRAIRLRQFHEDQSLLCFALTWPNHEEGALLRLGCTAEQCLFLIHAEVLRQRSSRIIVPDVAFGEVRWGGRRQLWPKNWRQEIAQVLFSLIDIRFEKLRLNISHWPPRLGASSVLLSRVEDCYVLGSHENRCREECLLSDGGVSHNHYLIEIGYGFLGVLEHCAESTIEPALRSYDFRLDDASIAGDSPLRQAINGGAIVTISAPVAILGPAKWCKISEAQRRIIQALLRERTRRPNLMRGDKVPGVAAREYLRCPFLSTEEAYVSFCGNGQRSGRGYLLVGKRGTGWLRKCGYDVPDQSRQRLRSVQRFLEDVASVQSILGLTVVGLDAKSKKWLEWSAIKSLATGSLLSLLPTLHVRVYAAADFETRVRQFFESMGGFKPSSAEQFHGCEIGPPLDSEAPNADLAERIRQAGFSQIELARQTGVKQPFISQILNGVRPCPEQLRVQLIELLTSRERSAPAAPNCL
jgi:hypothetical protein